MQLGQVVGYVVATRKDERLVGSKLLITQPIRPDGSEAGPAFIAVDTVGAGIGERVIVAVGSIAAKAMQQDGAPVDAAIIGIVDSVDWARTGG